MEYTQEQIAELEEKAQLADELKLKAEQLEAEKNGVVAEMKELRAKRQEPPVVDVNDIEAKTRAAVKAVLDEEKSNQIEMTRSEFEASFRSSHPEFQPANDVGDIKWNAFKKVLGRFNTTGVTRETEFAEVYNMALKLLREPIQIQSQTNRGAFSPASTSSIAEAPDNDLSSLEQKLIQENGWTKERYLKLKESQPSFVRQLLSQVTN